MLNVMEKIAAKDSKPVTYVIWYGEFICTLGNTIPDPRKYPRPVNKIQVI
jgi:hypothetical protein